MVDLQNKLEFLLDKYSVETKAVLKDCKTAVIDGKDTPIFSHRLERRFGRVFLKKAMVSEFLLKRVIAVSVAVRFATIPIFLI